MEEKDLKTEEVKGGIVDENMGSTIVSKVTERKKHQDELKKLIEADKKKDFWRNVKKSIIGFIVSIFTVNTYVRIIQRFEDLLLTIFVDSLILFTLSSLVYIIYIIIDANEDDDLSLLIFKGCGCVVVAIICLVAQRATPNVDNVSNEDILISTKRRKQDELEDEEG